MWILSVNRQEEINCGIQVAVADSLKEDSYQMVKNALGRTDSSV